jgi:hypothetical protein
MYINSKKIDVLGLIRRDVLVGECGENFVCAPFFVTRVVV